MNKKRKIILIIWVILILILILILLLFLNLLLPKIPKLNQSKISNNQLQYQYQFIYNINKFENVIKLMNVFKHLKQLHYLKNKQRIINYNEDEIIKTNKNNNFISQLEQQIEYQFQSQLNNNVIPNITQDQANKILLLGLIILTLPPLGVVCTAASVIPFLSLLF